MAEIIRISHPELDLTERIVVGPISVAEVLAEITSFYSGPITRLVLWDISQASAVAVSGDDMSRISTAVVRHNKLRADGGLRAGGKSAVVAASDLAFGFSRMYQAYREMQNVEWPYMSFRTRQEAIDWLCSDSK